MPFYLGERDLSADLDGVRSVLLVPCGFCPAASLAVRRQAPYLDVFRAGWRTPVYDAHVGEVKAALERRGVAVELYRYRWPQHFVVCMWTAARRNNVARRAGKHDAVIVLGCDAAADTLRQSLGSSGCRVVPAMRVEGLMNVIPAVRFPLRVWLTVSGMTRVLEYAVDPTATGTQRPDGDRPDER